ncbi:MAG TPA: RagB/SusD family nutrient uptake outer membrane protein [Prolixibacteraceae bacterium]|nr:RagB/SusD family nutrient uptake outer membrane protein [Prolixibacteraceae bacterium]
MEEFAGSLIREWFITLHEYYSPASVLLVAADAGTCSWSQWRVFSSEPREEWDNHPTNPYAPVSANYYHNLYSTLASANNVVNWMKENGETLENAPMCEAVAYFVQGLCLGYLGLIYDQAFAITHESNLGENPEPVSYQNMLSEALKSLDKAITLSETASFILPSEWLPGDSWNQGELARLARSFAARFLVYGVRGKNENQTTDWDRVYRYASEGIQKDFAPLADDESWYSMYHMYSNYSGWVQTDMYVIHLMDPNMPARYPQSGLLSDLPQNGKATSNDARLESDFQYLSSCPFRPERGYYHFSTYRYQRLDAYLSNRKEPMPEFRKAENDYLLAEAAVHTGKLQEAADLMNRSARVTRGRLPLLPPNSDSILTAIHYERMVELMSSGFGIQFFEMRKENLLQEGTPLHYPIPGSELILLERDYYTFGGSTGIPGIDISNGGW